MANRPINTSLLNLTIESKIESGVDAVAIRRLIYAFTPDTSVSEQNDDIVEFLWVDDIPHEYRGEFLAHLVALSPPDDEPVRELAPLPPAPPFGASAVNLWRTVIATLGLTPLSTAPFRQ